MVIPFAIPDITDQEIHAVQMVMQSGWLTTGPRTKEFEKKFLEAVGAKHAVAVNSCTSAMHLALESLGIKQGDEVIVPTMTFAATAEVVRYLGATPVLVDIDKNNHNMDPKSFRQAISSKTKAVVPVHFGGQACDMSSIIEIAEENGIFVVEDAAHAFPCRYHGRQVGSIGVVTCFSFYATKTITTGEGGMAVTNDDKLANRMRVMSLHGISKDAWKRYSSEGSWYYEIEAPGFKYNMTDVAAAMGIVQLDRAEEMLNRRRKIAEKYLNAFHDLRGLEMLSVTKFEDHAWHLFVVRLKRDELKIDRKSFIERLRENEIGASVHFIPLHMHPYYRDTYNYNTEDLPVAADVYSRSFSLPIYSKMSDADVETVIAHVREIHNNARL